MFLRFLLKRWTKKTARLHGKEHTCSISSSNKLWDALTSMNLRNSDSSWDLPFLWKKPWLYFPNLTSRRTSQGSIDIFLCQVKWPRLRLSSKTTKLMHLLHKLEECNKWWKDLERPSFDSNKTLSHSGCSKTRFMTFLWTTKQLTSNFILETNTTISCSLLILRR